jgi:hypothetical protein
MKARMGLVLGLALALSRSVIAAPFDDKEDLAKAAKKATEMESYKFKMTIELEGLPMVQGPIEFSGEYAKGVSHISGEFNGQEFEAYKKGKKTANKNQEGDWVAGGKGGRGGMNASQMKAPHEELKDAEKKFKDVKKSDKKETVNSKECSIYEGELTDEAAKDALPGGGGRMLGANAEINGKGKIFVDGDGVIQKMVLVSEIKASIQGQDLEITATRTTELHDIGKAEVKVPDDVAKLLEEEKKDEPSVDPKKKDEPKEEKKEGDK